MEDFWRFRLGRSFAMNRFFVAIGILAALAILYQGTFGGDELIGKLKFSRATDDRSFAIDSISKNRGTNAPIVIVAPSPSPNSDFSSSKISSRGNVAPSPEIWPPRGIFSPPGDSSSQISPASSPSGGENPSISSEISPSEAENPSISFEISESEDEISPSQAEFEISQSQVEIPQPEASPSIFSPAPSSINSSSSIENHRQVPQWRVSLEQGLREVKIAIEATTASNIVLDSHLTRSIYHDAYKFQRSYELMEKFFRIYMYKEGKPRLVHKGPLEGIYSSEGRFIHEMNQNSRFVTDDPKAAHMFFLPYSVAHMVLDLYVPNSHTMLPLATFIKDYVNDIAARHPYWNMTRGSDHFFVSCHDWGPATARDHLELRTHAIKVVCNADTTEEYVVSKDVSLPETYLHSVKLPTRFGGPGADKRSILAFFAGQMHGRVRPVLLKYWKDKDPDMRIYEVLPKAIAKQMSYEGHMKSSKFCICAAGYEVNSPRIVEAIYYECVPVLIADNFVLPFSDVINWDSFSITVAEKDIPRLKSILMGVSPGRYRSMQAKLKRVRQHFLWHENAQRFDMFHMILHSVWMRRLQQLDTIVGFEEQLAP